MGGEIGVFESDFGDNPTGKFGHEGFYADGGVCVMGVLGVPGGNSRHNG